MQIQSAHQLPVRLYRPSDDALERQSLAVVGSMILLTSRSSIAVSGRCDSDERRQRCLLCTEHVDHDNDDDYDDDESDSGDHCAKRELPLNSLSI